MPLQVSYAAASDIGRVRRRNEDSLFADALAGVFVVADGMGGHAGGDIASQIAAQAIGEELSGSTQGASVMLEDVLSTAIENANRRILDAAASDPKLAGMGTTVTVLLLLPESYLIGQVGDSRAYLLRGDKLKRITRDHTIVQAEVDRGILTDEQARTHPRSHVLTRALGVCCDCEPDFYRGELRGGDRLLLASDGLTSMLPQDEIEAAASAQKDPTAAAEALVGLANGAGGADNITVIVVDLEDAGDRS